MRWRHVTLLAVAVALLLATGAGCGGPDQAKSSDGKKKESAEDVLAKLNAMPSQERPKALLEGAKKEGTVVWYGAWTLAEAEPFIKLFEEKYPGIKVQYTRGPTAATLDKVLSEAAGGLHQVDLINVSMDAYPEMAKANVLGKYFSPEAETYPKIYRDPKGYWTAKILYPGVFAYNTKLIPDGEAPKNWEDLLNPRWKGKLGIPETRGVPMIVGLNQFWGEARAGSYLEKLLEQDVQVHNSDTSLAEMVASGDVPVGFAINMAAAANIQKKGGPLKTNSPEPLLMNITSLYLAKAAPHPYAAALLYDFNESREGQEIALKGSVNFSPRADVPNPYSYVTEGRSPVVLGEEAFAGPIFEKAQDLWKTRFVKRQK